MSLLSREISRALSAYNQVGGVAGLLGVVFCPPGKRVVQAIQALSVLSLLVEPEGFQKGAASLPENRKMSSGLIGMEELSVCV